ncbi:MAG: hypothetical protein A3C44_06080 [Gammaproteobacteria bacterium RIFCSPHIGHO2_02_FULL_39_13]|nr:MAG: hypothetical protein A3C44_06080 [Gammaproteobacteria bacterium RIFCSPHIGHO2_02_FULL_39_13]OGT49279.1 MAG: hypothetical protein A3E53_07460 [Gammaproteobacteria bacterium RIFCSPHIGHO2_12_FULL_39_24]
MSEQNNSVKKIIIGVIAVIIIAIIVFYFIKPIIIQDELPKPIVIDTQHQPTMGNPAAKVQIVAFEDLKCINCARFNINMMPYIKKHYIDTQIAKYTMINLAFVEGSMPAATAAHCLYSQNKALFFPFVEYIFAHQPPENQDWATIPTLMNFASQIPGVNMDQLAKCLLENPYDQLFQNNLNQAKTIMKGSVSTPTVYINGILVNPLTKNQIDKVIEAVK